jgi:signal peptidase I
MNLKKGRKILSKIISIIMYAVFLLLLMVAVTLIAYFIKVKVDLSNGNYNAQKYNAFIIVSQSMYPTIKVNDAIITKKMAGEALKVGDIITFVSSDNRFNGFTITHRIIEKTELANGSYSFKTKGDYNNVADLATVNEENITGKVILKIPMVGYIQYFLSTSFGWVIAVLIPCLGIIVYDFVVLVEKIYRKKRKKKKT